MFVLEKVVKFVWLKILKTSHRNWSDLDSLRRILFASVASNLVVGGPRMVLRPAFPTRLTPAGGFAKQAVLNHCVTRCGAPAFGSQLASGLPPAGDVASRNPRP